MKIHEYRDAHQARFVTPRPQPHVHREREDAWCTRIDLERAVEALPYELRMIWHLLEEGYSDREIASRLAAPAAEVQAWKRNLALHMRRELGEA